MDHEIRSPFYEILHISSFLAELDGAPSSVHVSHFFLFCNLRCSRIHGNGRREKRYDLEARTINNGLDPFSIVTFPCRYGSNNLHLTFSLYSTSSMTMRKKSDYNSADGFSIVWKKEAIGSDPAIAFYWVTKNGASVKLEISENGVFVQRETRYPKLHGFVSIVLLLCFEIAHFWSIPCKTHLHRFFCCITKLLSNWEESCGASDSRSHSSHLRLCEIHNILQWKVPLCWYEVMGTDLYWIKFLTKWAILQPSVFKTCQGVAI